MKPSSFSYSTVKESSKAFSFEVLIKNITLIEKVEDFCKSLDQITSYRFDLYGKPDPDIYYMKDLIKIRLMELEKLQTQRIDELIKNFNEKGLFVGEIIG
jgi:hypothetical protein